MDSIALLSLWLAFILKAPDLPLALFITGFGQQLLTASNVGGSVGATQAESGLGVSQLSAAGVIPLLTIASVTSKHLNFVGVADFGTHVLVTKLSFLAEAEILRGAQESVTSWKGEQSEQ